MTSDSQRTIRIAAALIDDDRGRLFLVRKAGTAWFMQAGGKIEPGEGARTALLRELREELGLTPEFDPRHLGQVSAPAANEPGCRVEAELFHVRIGHTPVPCAEIEEARWVEIAAARTLRLAPLTRRRVLLLALTLRAPAVASGAPEAPGQGSGGGGATVADRSEQM